MSKIFDHDLDEEFNFKPNNEYAKNYDNWRKKEELNRLKTKYGEENVNLDADGSSSSSEDDEDGVELTKEVEKEFYKTLSCLKNKDPRIYDENVKFFHDKNETARKDKKRKEQPVFLKDYERNIILEKGGKLSDSEDENEDNRPQSPTYVEEQKKIKENLKKALDGVEGEDDENWGGLFQKRVKSKEEITKNDEDFKEWLVGQKKQLNDKATESELKPLKEYWNNPKLDKGEQFLENEDENYIPTYDEIVHSDASLSGDEEAIEKQEEFEHKYNFRFEEPDQDFIKRYPRTMENSLRWKDDKRSVKRQETKERKVKEKEEKMKDIKKLQELKRKEIEEKIEKLKEITGNTDVGFQDDDLDGDFDPEAHDRRMQALFDNEFYEGAEDDQKPEFPDLDEELEIERWDRFEETDNGDNLPHCEDENFNMDCDYDPNQSTQDELMENSKGKKKKKRKSKFAEAVSKPKPKFDPNDKTYQKYLDEYYALDCEDIIGDIPCRFKYRKVVPNDFGLTTEEILMAKDRELNKWCSLKKTVQIRPDHIEKYDQIAFSKKAQNVGLKKKLLPSLFDEDKEAPSTSNASEETSENDKRKPSKINGPLEEKIDDVGSSKIPAEKDVVGKKKGKEKQTNEDITSGSTKSEEINEDKQVSGKKNKRKIKEVVLHEDTEIKENKIEQISKEKPGKTISSPNKKNKKKKKKQKKPTENSTEVSTTTENDGKSTKNMNANKRKRNNTENGKQNKKFKKNNKNEKDIGISDARLQAYGIKPKKFKNKLKYGNKNSN
ncbi:unnamed protein product [Brassicogethes aeneus]|uniref:Protein KRI1 homolog n=1 Tax=Brassicogethes aeneus TaxID=1431903 RepID=A0A9P0AZM8_BRAAE|nr:unnamed protein product [Brassicogethes aeneus]